jgi:hypothetical protein
VLLLGTSLACLFGLPNVYTVLHRDKHDIECFSFVCCVCVCGRLDDALNYSEPWPWMHPPRHALGALLLDQGQIEEATRVYRADLGLDPLLPRPSWHPDNVWSLHGLVECYERSTNGAMAEEFRPRLRAALGDADISLDSSCACRRHL